MTAATASWPVKPRIVVEQADKQEAMRMARAALAKSGTTTLELAISGIPMAAAYRVSGWKWSSSSGWCGCRPYILANLVIGQNIVPELLQEDLHAGKARRRAGPVDRRHAGAAQQIEAFSWPDVIMEIGTRATPAARAADIVLGLAAPSE